MIASSPTRCDGFFSTHCFSGSLSPISCRLALCRCVGVGPVLLLQPGGVLRDVGERLVADRLARLAQDPPALLDARGIHEVDPHELRVVDVVLGERRVQGAVDRVLVPRLARRPRLRDLGQPQLEALVRRVGVEQAVQRGGAGARQATDEDRSLDRHLGVRRVLLEAVLGEQPAHQRALDERALHVVALGRQAAVLREVLAEQAQPFLVLGPAEVVHARWCVRRPP